MNFKIYLLFLIFILISPSEIPTLQTAIEYSFDEKNNQFYYDAKSYRLIIYVSHSYVAVRLKIGSITQDITSPGTVIVNSVSNLGQNIVSLTFFPKYEKLDKEKKGTISIHELNSYVDLNNKINCNYPIYLANTDLGKITYNVNKLDKDMTIKFEYNSRINNEIVDYELNNPFMVCDENEDCDEYISSYNFKKGHSYRICTKFQYKNYNYFLPAFSFYPSNTNNNYICLNIFVLITYLIFLLL